MHLVSYSYFEAEGGGGGRAGGLIGNLKLWG